MPIIDTPAGTLEVTNAILSASEFRATQKISVSNSAPTKNFSVGDKFHVSTTDADAVNITGNLVAQKLKIGNLLVSPTFDLAAVSNVGNTTSNTLQFANATTSFVASSNVEIGGNITLTSNAQVKVGSNVLAEYTGPHGREPKEMPLKKFPEIAFEEGKFDSNESTNVYVQAGYTVTASSQNSSTADRFAYQAFNSGATVHEWRSSGGAYTGADGIYDGTTHRLATTDTDGDAIPYGEWLKIKMPKKIQLNSVVLKGDPGFLNRTPEDFKIYGSNDGNTWKLLITQTNLVPVSGGNKISPTSTLSVYYDYYALVTTKLYDATQTDVAIEELEYYGYEEPAPPGDLSLDTTLKSTFNSVRSNNYVMYFDGEDPAAGNVPKNLVNDSSISITPHNAVFDTTNNCWTLDGSTESNVTTGSLGFEGDVPHTVSTWINASNLEANALTQQLFSIGSGYDKAFLKVDDTQIAANTWHNVTYAYQGEGGSKVTYVDGRKVEEAQVEDTFGEYPPFAMTDYEQGGFIVTASHEYNQTDIHDDAYRMFNKTNTTASYWTPAADYSTSDGSFVVPTTGSFTHPNWHFLTNGIAGHWVQIKMPYKIKVDYVKFSSSAISGRHAKDATIFGSNDDGDTWYTVGSWTNNTANNLDLQTFVMNTSEYYDTYRLVVTRSGGSSFLTLTELQFYGHKEGDLTRFPEPTRVLKYPHIAMTGPGQRGYVASASSDNSGNNPAYKVFDHSTSDGWSTSGTYTPSGGFGIPTNSPPTLNGTGVPGEYLILQLPHKLRFSSVKLMPRNTNTDRCAESGNIYGSDDGTNWQFITSFSGKTYTSGNFTTIDINASTAYYRFAIVVTRIGNTANGVNTSIGEMELFGTQEDTGTPAIVGGPFAGKVANFRVYDQYLGDERIQEIYDAQKDEFGHKKSSMTFYKGRIGVGTTEPEGALTVVDEPHALAKFPARAISADVSYVEGDGQIKLSAAGGSGYQAFDGLSLSSWVATPTRNTRLSEEVDFGAWLKIESSDPISLKKALITSNPSWTQVGTQTYGGSIDHTTANTHFGRAVACNHDGTRVIAGGYPAGGLNIGMARVYDWNGSSWTQVGQNLTGDNSGDHFGYTVAISGDGNIIAVGAPYENSNGSDSGTVRVYYLMGGQWTILPDSGTLTSDVDVFLGSTVSGYLGLAGTVKLSYDGKTIAMAEPNYDSGGVTNRGRTQVFTYTNGEWSQKGTDFLGVYASEALGRGIDLSEDGNHIILVTDIDGNNSTNGPRAEVYKWNASVSPPAWQLKGPTLGSEVGWGDGYGGNGPGISISNDGNTIAIGIMFADIAEGGTGTDTGSVEVYHYNASNNTWGPTGSGSGIQASLTAGYKLTKVFDKSAHRFGDSVSLSGDGKRLIVAESHADYGVTNGGRLYTFEYTGDEWILRDMRTTGNTLGRRIGADGRSNGYIGMAGSGQGLAISRDGSTIVGGEHGFGTPASMAGAVRIFNMPSNIKSIWGSNDDVNWTKIVSGPTREEATSNVAGFQFGYNDEIDITNIDNPNYYKYHAIVADAFTQLKDIKLFGVRNQVSSTLHDGALTLTKNLNVPRIGPPLDADDTPRRDRLVVEYNTSTNPTFDGTVRDTSGRGNDGVFYGGASYDVTKKAWTNASQYGTGDYVYTKTHFGSGDFPFAMSFWVKMTQAYNGIMTMVALGSNATNKGMAIDIYNAGSFYWYGKDGSHQLWNTAGTNQTSDIFPIGEWVHVAVVHNEGGGAATDDVYINGASVPGTASINNADAINFDNNPDLVIGARWATASSASSDFCPASYSNFKLYDTALTASEVKTLYDMGRMGSVANPQTLQIASSLDVRGDIYGGCPVFFTAYAGGGSGVTVTGSSSGTIIVFNNTVVNKGGAYDTSNGRCTFPISGYYEVFFRGGSANTAAFHAKIYGNGNAPGSGGWPNNVMRLYDDSGGTYRNGGTIQFFYYFTAGEYIDVRMTNSSVFNADNYNSFSVKYLSN